MLHSIIIATSYLSLPSCFIHMESIYKEKMAADGCLYLPQFLSDECCNKLIDSYKNTIKYSNEEFLRVKSYKFEKHRFSKFDHVINPLLNVHELPNKTAQFSDLLLEIIEQSELPQTVRKILGENPVLVQTMYFESNKGTERHFDGDLFDSTKKGQVIGCWVALEDVSEEAGSFYYYPKSCFLNDDKEVGLQAKEKYQEYLDCVNKKVANYQENDKAQLYTIYKKGNQLLDESLELAQIKQVTRSYKKGDVVFFNSNLLHGSFRPKFNGKTRHSFSVHFISESQSLVRHAKETIPLNIIKKKNLAIHSN
ncbi:phytanoyl-CoA dioxygenase family protein [Bernardetia sp. ABR2-2B]|uniref:phytanoyl-CoA dioxygenase family protein n=1 Tax=Bernardetia sp. ABR2-2B TaxID=3127472 RepID=UPI0030D5EB3E